MLGEVLADWSSYVLFYRDIFIVVFAFITFSIDLELTCYYAKFIFIIIIFETLFVPLSWINCLYILGERRVPSSVGIFEVQSYFVQFKALPYFDIYTLILISILHRS